MPSITPSLWFDSQAEAAANFYVSVFPNSKINALSHYGEGAPFPAGTVLTAEFELDGKHFQALNGGPYFTLSEAISFVVDAPTQQDIDYYWNALTADGGEESQCGWLKDKFGVSWQIVPPILGELMSGPDAEKAGRVMQAMLGMKKLDIEALTNA